MPKQKQRTRKPLEFLEPSLHLAKYDRPHIAQEFADMGREEFVTEMTAGLRPHFAMCAAGRVSPGFKPKKLALEGVV